MVRRGSVNQPYVNDINEAIFSATGATSDYQTLINLTTRDSKNQMTVLNTSDEDLKLRFTGDGEEENVKELTIKAQTDYAFDRFPHDGLIEYKHDGVTPTSGIIQIVSW